ncbi:MAG: Oxidoreductase domain protein [Candidatus Uhrbacteria bacterium GW2011_GWF2_41_16]|uniref:Oxidoreductase domain protein n=1 Tax=Candidatus Uhrbacteria bacterium GW2011_GWF2_41_16 TaxID=1618997 RepID=A0A0G0V4S1_9BACT|nr:MAG: Oxidoreductase domain protein [Candidatus Uhrbacteria bacterium GW2011_GWF2_41_16]
MGSVQLKRLAERNDVEVVALFEKNTERGKEVLRSLCLDENLLVDDYDKIVNNPDIDAVWLVSPNSFHAPQAIAAMKVGKHVFSEKPAATTFADFCTEIELEKANPKLITFVDYILYFDSMEQRLRDMVSNGQFGQITQIQINYRHPVNIAGDKVWKLDKNIMGDAIGMGINHAISVMIFAMASQAKPVGVYATSAPAQIRGFEADPIWAITIHFDNGATGFCFGNIDNGNGYDAYHNIFGTDGGFIFESQIDRPYKVRYWSNKTTEGKWIRPLDKSNAGDLAWPEDTTTPDSGNVVEHQTGSAVGHFIDCVKNKTKSPLSFVNSQIIAEIGWAAQMSASLKQPVSLPLNWNEVRKFFKD